MSRAWVAGLTLLLALLVAQAAQAGVNFTPATLVPSGHFPTGVALGDLNGDNQSDAVTANAAILGAEPLGLSVYLGSAGGGFVKHADLATGGSPSHVALADLNGDGKLDAVVWGSTVSGAEGGVGILLGDGSGGFSYVTKPLTTSNSARGVVTADFDGDGKLDIAVSDTTAHTVTIYRNTSIGGTLSFAASPDVISITGHDLGELAVGDLNGDHKSDVVIADGFSNLSGSGGAPGSGFTVLVDTSTPGSISFAPSSDVATGFGAATALATGDFNHDGKTDVAAVELSGSAGPDTSTGIAILLGGGTGGFGAGSLYPAGPLPTEVASTDMNLDGKADLVTSEDPSGANILLGSGDGTFAAPISTGSEGGASGARGLALADVNHDGAPDIVHVLDSDAANPSFEGDLATILSAPNVAIAPPTLTFGSIAPGSTSAPQTVTATSTAAVTAHISAIRILGTGARDFQTRSDTCTGVALAPGTSCTIGVAAAPVELGGLSASLSLLSDAPGTAPAVLLSGTGAVAAPPPAVLLSGTGAVPAPACAFTKRSRKITVGPGDGKSGKGRSKKVAKNALLVAIRCNQAAQVTLAGTITEKLKPKPHKKHGKSKKVGIAKRKLNVRADIPMTVALKLRNAAIRALVHGIKESAALTLVAANTNGTIKVGTTIRRLKAVKVKRGKRP